MTRKPYEHQWYPSPIVLPEKKVGKFSIRHRMITERTPIVGVRQALMRGIRPLDAAVKTPFRIHELFEEEHGIWMTDLPEELNQIEEMLYTVRPKDRVLVGGLGLGIVATRLCQLDAVKSVTVVELNKEVIKLCSDESLYHTHHAPILDFLKSDRMNKTRFDYYLIDTWCGTGEAAWWEQVMPVRRAIRNRWGKKPVIHCWAEDIMLAQVKRSLVIDDMKKELLTQLNREHPEKHLTIQQCRVWFYKNFPVDMTPKQADWFLENVGTEEWEKKYSAIVDNLKEE